MTLEEQSRLQLWLHALDLGDLPLHHSLLAASLTIHLENLTRQGGGYGLDHLPGLPQRLYGEPKKDPQP